MIKIELFENFRKKFKTLARKNKNIINNLKELEQTLKQNPKSGVSLGFGLYKIKMANSSKKIGKRGGFRVISYFVDENDILYLVEIYEKNSIENIALSKLKKIIQNEME